jgi:SNF2 family DNA or RNA helicase
MGMIRSIPPRFKHQDTSVKFFLLHNCAYDASDPGTGKTRSQIDTILERRRMQLLHDKKRKKALILAPKSILRPAWLRDIRTFAPELSVSVAFAANRKKAFDKEADVYVTNHDAVKWIEKNLDLSDYDTIIIDEITAFKHRTSQRSKALAKVAKKFKYRYGLSGTPNSNTILDLWHQIFVLDDGVHLGTNFFKFRNTVCEPTQVGPDAHMVQWADKIGAQDAVADILTDLTIRHVFEDCIDIPSNTVRAVPFDLSPKHLAQWEQLKRTAVLELKGKTISGIHAGALANKLLQAASGAVYDGEHIAQVIATERYELVMELAGEREQCVIPFVWTHQRDEMVKIALKKQFTYAIIDGSANDSEREKAVEDFQAGRLKIIFTHPKSGAHGLTLTKGTTTIWPGPIYDAELFTQLNKRIYRAGQTRKTETLLIAATGTTDAEVYEKLNGKLDRMSDLLAILETE